MACTWDRVELPSQVRGAVHSRVAPDTDEDNVGALAEAGWSEKEIMVVLDDKTQAGCAQRQRSPPV